MLLTPCLMSVTRNKAWPLLTAYGTSKFAIRGLTQNAGLLFFKKRKSIFTLGPLKRWTWGNMASQSMLMHLVRFVSILIFSYMIGQKKILI